MWQGVGEKVFEEGLQLLLDVLRNDRLNQHLIMSLLDIVLSHILPEFR